MAAPLANKIILPSDVGNTGKFVRTQTRIVGADTVHEHFFVPVSARSKLGVYHAHSGRQTILAAAHAATAGFAWLLLPAAITGKVLGVRRVEFFQGPAAATAFVSTPQVTMERLTFTGTATGAQVTPARRDSADPVPVGELRTASTGMTIAAGAVVDAFMIGAVLTAVGIAIPNRQIWTPEGGVDNEEGELVIRPGEAVVWRQADAGTASDTRVCWWTAAWEEYEI